LVSKQPNENGEETMLGADETGSRLGGQERVGLGDGGACSFLELLPVLLEARPRARHPTQPPCARSKVDVILARDRDAALSQRPNDHIVVQTWRMVGRLGASARECRPAGTFDRTNFGGGTVIPERGMGGGRADGTQG